MTWHPIETHPKGHLSMFLVWASPRSGTDIAIYEAIVFADGLGDGFRLKDRYGDSQEYGILKRVTHWMPLPEPPSHD